MRNPPQVHIAAPGDHLIKLVELEPKDLLRATLQRTTLDLDAFLAYLKRWTNVETSSIFYTKTGVVCLLDDRGDRPPGTEPDTVNFDFTRPSVAMKWLKIIGKPMKHEDFRTFLEERFAEITNSATGKAGGDLYTLISNLSISKTFTYDATLNDKNNYKVGYISAAGGNTAEIPKWVNVTIPLMNGLTNVYNLVMKLEFDVPKTEGEKPIFTLTCPDLEDVFELVAKEAMAKVAEALPGYLVIYGHAGGVGGPRSPF